MKIFQMKLKIIDWAANDHCFSGPKYAEMKLIVKEDCFLFAEEKTIQNDVVIELTLELIKFRGNDQEK